jgi:hypothetical protein
MAGLAVRTDREGLVGVAGKRSIMQTYELRERRENRLSTIVILLALLLGLWWL